MLISVCWNSKSKEGVKYESEEEEEGEGDGEGNGDEEGNDHGDEARKNRPWDLVVVVVVVESFLLFVYLFCSLS